VRSIRSTQPNPWARALGLGLSICYGIVKEHDGEIRLANLQPHGSLVTVELPLGVSKALSNAAKAAEMG
jgi:K+-sensing histidine kinase KdpD